MVVGEVWCHCMIKECFAVLNLDVRFPWQKVLSLLQL